MRAGADAIVQASLGRGQWIGRADVLLRVPEPSDLGDWSYEVVDTKLAQETRGGTVLQLCLYSDLVAAVQGRAPSQMHVVRPGQGFPRESFRYEDFAAYYRLVRRRLEEAIAAPPSQSTYPHPVAHCDICRWARECDARRHADDNLCLVAGIRPLHIGELERQGIRTLEQFAEEPAPLREKPARGNTEAFARAHGQARIQLAGQAGRTAPLRAPGPAARVRPRPPPRAVGRGRFLRHRVGFLRGRRRHGVSARRSIRRAERNVPVQDILGFRPARGAESDRRFHRFRHGPLADASRDARLPLFPV